MSDAQQHPPEVTDFETATRVAGGERRYTAEVHPSWDGPVLPHGGLLSAITINAIDAEVNPEGALQVRTISTHFLRPPPHGEVEIFVDPLRVGRRFTSTRATMMHGGKACLTMLATHSVRDLPEVIAWSPPPPVVAPPPERGSAKVSPESIAAGDPGWMAMPEGSPAFFSRSLLAPRFGHGPFAGPPVDPAVGTENGGWLVTLEPRPIDVGWLNYLVDSMWPSSLQPLRVPAVAPTLDLTTHIRGAIPADGLPDQPLLVHNITRAISGGLGDSDSFVYTADGELLAQARQLLLVMPLET
jgi:acyl-CoA thioesterase